MGSLLRKAMLLTVALLTVTAVSAASLPMALASFFEPTDVHCDACDDGSVAMTANGACGVTCAGAMLPVPECGLAARVLAEAIVLKSCDRSAWGRSIPPDPFPPRSAA